ncbi:sperm flagellar protein 1 [Spea bombifrons]|uniref:sperm flagellar protein 1 n=1 Tax=Spea bombifrons TaxID=233779 RepID=UPI00234AFFB5|nr:sperm flagellar protein 1 [Spea bombifrons]
MFDEETLHDLYAWVDKIPLSRPKRNITRDFSDGVLTAELVKFHFPKLVEMHNYVPANSTQQKVSNWTILNRKVLGKLNFSVPDDVIRKVAHCSPGVVELVLNTLRQKIEEKQKQTSAESSQVQSPRTEANHNADTGYSTKQKRNGAEHSPRPAGKTDHGSKTQSGYSQGAGADSGLRIQLAEKEQELMAAQESVQVLQVKLRRMERLLQLKNVRIDDLSRRLQEAEDRRV